MYYWILKIFLGFSSDWYSVDQRWTTVPRDCDILDLCSTHTVHLGIDLSVAASNSHNTFIILRWMSDFLELRIHYLFISIFYSSNNIPSVSFVCGFCKGVVRFVPMDVPNMPVSHPWGQSFVLSFSVHIYRVVTGKLFLFLFSCFTFLNLECSCHGFEPRLRDQIYSLLISFLNYYLHLIKELFLSDKPKYWESCFIRQCDCIVGTCCRRKTNVTLSLKLFGNGPLGFYIYFFLG